MWAFLASKAIALVMLGREEEGVATSREAQRHSDRHLFAYLAEVSGLGLLGRWQSRRRGSAFCGAWPSPG